MTSQQKESKGLPFRRTWGLPLGLSLASHYLRSCLQHRKGKRLCDWQESARYTVTPPLPQGCREEQGHSSQLRVLPYCSLPLSLEADRQPLTASPAFHLPPGPLQGQQ